MFMYNILHTVSYIAMDILEAACVSGKHKVAKRFINTYGYSDSNDFWFSISSNVKVIRYVCERYNISCDTITESSRCNSKFTFVCMRNNLHGVKYLCDKYDLSNHIESQQHAIISWVSSADKKGILQYLINRYVLDLRANINTYILCAIQSSNILTMQYYSVYYFDDVILTLHESTLLHYIGDAVFISKLCKNKCLITVLLHNVSKYGIIEHVQLILSYIRKYNMQIEL